MDSKEIIVELVVIGFGFLILTFLSIFYFDKQVIDFLVGLPSALLIITISVFCYVTGIVIDRLADWVFSFPEDYLRKNNVKYTVGFHDVRSDVFDKSPHVKEWVEYGRIRIRVVRGWSVNLLLMLGVLVWSHYSKGSDYLFSGKGTLVNTSVVFLFLGCLLSWISLTRSECKRLSQEYSKLNPTDTANKE